MKRIYISLPITGKEDTYEARLNAAVEYVKSMYPEYLHIVTPKDVAEEFEKERKGIKIPPTYNNFLLYDIICIAYCDAIFMCKGWEESKGCQAEYAFAEAIGLERYYQPK